MEAFLKKLPAKAAEKRLENREFFAWLKRKKPKALDAAAVAAHEEAFRHIDCLACANCCKTTGPLFTDRDIARIARHLGLKPGRFIERYLRVDEEGDYVLQSLPCPFLGVDNRCTIYAQRPRACAAYPHTDRRKCYQIGALTLRNTAICPAAYQVVEILKKAYARRF